MGNGARMSVINEMVGQTRDWVVGHRLHDLPTPKLTPMLAAKWLVDEWALQIETTNSRLRAPSIDFRRRQPEICWYEGSHLSFPLESKVTDFVTDAHAAPLGTPIGQERLLKSA